MRPPAGATVIDGKGKFVTPGLVDTNVHLSLYGGMGDRYETLAKYHPRQKEIVLEAAQNELKYGVTTVRDSYGLLMPLVAVRDEIAAGRAIGPRILAAGNIVGWGGPYSVSFSLTREQGLTLFQEQVNDEITQGAGEDLIDMEPEQLRTAIKAVDARGPDRRHRALRKTGVHWILTRSAACDRGRSAQAQPGSGDALDDARGTAPVGGGGDRSDSASRDPGDARDAGVLAPRDRRSHDRLLDAGEHDDRRCVEEASEGPR